MVYSPRSGDVHLLNSAACALLDALVAEALTSDVLVHRLAQSAARPPDDELRAAVEESLDSLDELGLVEPYRP